MIQPNQTHPGWVQGWGVIKGESPDWEFSGIFENRPDAEAAAVKAGAGFYTRWGGYNEDSKEFISGGS
jgi:hypothetical protein